MNDATQALAFVLLALLVIGLAGTFGYVLAGNRRYEAGRAEGYRDGYAAMKGEHESYRRQNAIALRAIQNLTPDNPATLGPPLERARTFDTSGAFDCHVETTRGRQAVGRGRTLEDARSAAKRFLERSTQTSTVIITQPGEYGARVEVERVDRLAEKPDEFAIGRRCTAEANNGNDRVPRQCIFAIGHLEPHNFGAQFGAGS